MGDKKVAIKISGSLLFTEEKKIDLKKISKFCNIIGHSNFYNRLLIICADVIIADLLKEMKHYAIFLELKCFELIPN